MKVQALEDKGKEGPGGWRGGLGGERLPSRRRASGVVGRSPRWVLDLNMGLVSVMGPFGTLDKPLLFCGPQ